MKGKGILSIADLDTHEIRQLVELGAHMKQHGNTPVLEGRTVALLFEKPSLRTRASFELAVHQLGGFSFYMGKEEVGLGVREAISDVARVLSNWVDCIVARVFSHSALEEFAHYSKVPVINALSDWEHPCQSLADLLTMYEHKGSLSGLKVAFVGDGNNVARSLALAVASVGSSFVIASPEGYELDLHSMEIAQNRASCGDGRTEVDAVRDPHIAVKGADVVYTDVWTSMGDEAEAKKRREDFQGYTVDELLMSEANQDAIFMHDMPVHYGEEVAPGMLDHPQSVVFDQAANRLHAQKALVQLIMGT